MAFLSQYNPKQRFRITLLSVLTLAFVAYYFSILNTINLNKKFKIQQARISIIEDGPGQIAQMRNQIKLLDESLSDELYNRNRLFSEISQFCELNQLMLTEFANEIRFQDQQLTYVTTPIIVKGGFHDIVQLIYQLEQKSQGGYLVHTNMEMKQKSRSKRKELTAEIYIQHLVKRN